VVCGPNEKMDIAQDTKSGLYFQALRAVSYVREGIRTFVFH